MSCLRPHSIFETYLGLGPSLPHQFLSCRGQGKMCLSYELKQPLADPTPHCNEPVMEGSKEGRAQVLPQLVWTRSCRRGAVGEQGTNSLGEAGTLTLPGARLQLLHPVHREPANTPAHGALLALALVVTLLQPDAHRWEPVPTVALCPGLQAGVDVGPAERVGPGVSPALGPELRLGF